MLMMGLATPALGAQGRSAAVDSVMAAAVANGFSGLAVFIRDGRMAFAQGYGLANRAGQTAYDSSTAFPIESITKQFTRAAILKLEQDGRLRLSDSISKFLGGLPADKRVITVGQLFDMRSGLGEYHERHGGGDTVPADHQRMSYAEAMDRIGAQPLRFAPGSTVQYSNSGYTLLAAIIEAVTKQPYARYVHETLLTPAGMTMTGFYGDKRWRSGSVSRATGPAYMENAPETWPEPSWVLMGSGGMISTAADLGRWIAAIRSGRLLNATALGKMYPKGDWAFYGGGNSVGYEVDVLELKGGAEIVILETNSGLGRLPLMVQLAEAVRQQPIPDAVRTGLAGALGSSGPAGQGGPGVQVVTQGGPPGDGGALGGQQRVVRQDGPDDPARQAVRALMTALRDGTTPALTKFATERLSDQMKKARPLAEYVAELQQLSRSLAESATVSASPAGPNTAEIAMEGAVKRVVVLTVESQSPFKIDRLSIR